MNKQSLSRIAVAGLIAITSLGGAAYAQMDGAQMDAGMGGEHTKMVGGAAMYPSRNIIQNAVNSKDHTTLVAAVKAAGLVDTLETTGPFTVFAPTNEAFARLPDGTVDSLLQPQNKGKLTAVLTYHVVAGRLTAADLLAKVRDGGGQATLTTVQGATLTVTAAGDHIVLTDAQGRAAHVTIGDVMQSNGVIHVVDTVLLPG
jgi:uncharacterized surface protein with fasciclin (FAS1) repeats